MALAEKIRDAVTPPPELPQEHTDTLPIILADLRGKFGDRFTPDAIREYVEGTNDEAKKASKAVRQMQITRTLAPHEFLVVTFTGKIDAFIYAHPIKDKEGNVLNKGAWEAGGLQFVGGWTPEKYD